MIKKKQYLLITLFISFIFACKLPTASNAGSGASIIDRYPYWNVKIKCFSVEKPGLTITVEEKKFVLQLLALMRLIVNTPEFEELANTQTAFNKIRPFNKGEYPGGKWNVYDVAEVIDRPRVVETVQKADYTVEYVKKDVTGVTFMGEVRELSYVFLGYRPYNYGRKVWMNNSVWGGGAITKKSFIVMLFHEHIHNLGYSHNIQQPGGAGAPNLIADDLAVIYDRVVSGDLQSKYARDLEELTNYYLKTYEEFLKEDTK